MALLLDPQPLQKVPIQHVLAHVSAELSALSRRLQDVETLLFDRHLVHEAGPDRLRMQDMDLIIQQVADLGRAIMCVAEVELEDLSVRTSVLGDRLHLNDLRQRLLGLSEDKVLDGQGPSSDILFF